MLRRTVAKSHYLGSRVLLTSIAIPSSHTIPSWTPTADESDRATTENLGNPELPSPWSTAVRHVATCDGCSVVKGEGLSVPMTENEAIMFGSHESAATAVHERRQVAPRQLLVRSQASQQHNRRSTTGASSHAISLRNGYHASRRSNATVHGPSPTYSALEAVVSDMAPTAAGASTQHIYGNAVPLSPSASNNRHVPPGPLRCDGCSTHSNSMPPAPSNPIHDSELHAVFTLPSPYTTTIPLNPQAFLSNVAGTFIDETRLTKLKNHSILNPNGGLVQRKKVRVEGPFVAPTTTNEGTKHRKSKSTIGNSKENTSPDSSQYVIDADLLKSGSRYPAPYHTSNDMSSAPSSAGQRLYPQTTTYHNPSSTASMFHRIPTCSFDSPHFNGVGSGGHSSNGALIGATGMMAASTVAARPGNTMRALSSFSLATDNDSMRAASCADHFSEQRRFYTSDSITRTPAEERLVTQEPNGNGGMGHREEFHKAISRRLLEGVRRGVIDPADIVDNLHNIPDIRKTVLYPRNKDIPMDPMEEALMAMENRTAEDVQSAGPQMPGTAISIAPTVGHSFQVPSKSTAAASSEEALLTNVLKEEADLALSRFGMKGAFDRAETEKPPTPAVGPIAELTANDGNDVSVLRPVDPTHKMSDDDRYNVNAPTERANSTSVVRDSDSNYHRLRRKSSLPSLNYELRRLRKQSSAAEAAPSVSKVLPPAITRDADGYAILRMGDDEPVSSGAVAAVEGASSPSVDRHGSTDRMEKFEAMYSHAEHPNHQASIVLPDAAVDSFAIGGRAQLLKFSDSALRTKVLTKRRRDRVRQQLGSEAVMGIAVTASGHQGNTEFVVSPQRIQAQLPSISKKAIRKLAAKRNQKRSIRFSRKSVAESKAVAAEYNNFLSQNDREALSIQSDENFLISNNPTRNEPTIAPTAFGMTLSQVPGLPEGVQMRTSDGTVRISPDKESKWWMDVKRKRWISKGMGGQTRDANRGLRYYKP